MSSKKIEDSCVAKLEKERDAYVQTLNEAVSAFNARTRELTILRRITDSIRWGVDLEAICVGVVDIVADEVGADSCSLWLVGESGSDIELIAARGRENSKAGYFAATGSASVRLPLGQGAAGWVASDGASLLVDGADEDSRSINMDTDASRPDAPSLYLPIVDNGKVLGVLSLSHRDIADFSKKNERVLDLITAQAAMALSNLCLVRRVQRFNEQLERMVSEKTMDLRYSESKYRFFTENTSEAVFVVEREGGRIVEANRRACEFTSYSKSELTGKNIETLFSHSLMEGFHQTLRTGGGRIDGGKMRRRSGEEFCVDMTVSVFLTHTGEVAHLIVRDAATSRVPGARLKDYSRRLEDLVEEKTEELQAVQDNLVQVSKMAAIGEMASGVAHEINNPIAVISGYAEDLAEKAKSGGWKDVKPEDVLWSLSIIAGQAEKCREIISSILNLTRRREMNVTAFDINGLVRQIASLSIPTAEEKRPKTIFRLSPGIPPARTDSNMLEQVLLNIYNNAVAAVGQSNGVIITETSFDGIYVRILIKDNGAGIAPSDLLKIFNPFFTTKPAGKGTGLGLSICRQLIERLHGRIGVESEFGRYTKFTITIPIDVSLIEHKGEKEDAKNGESKDSVASCRR